MKTAEFVMFADRVPNTPYFCTGLVKSYKRWHDSGERDTAHLRQTLNSTFAQLIINLSGRANLGGDALKLELYEFEGLTLPNPSQLTEPDATISAATDWNILTPSTQRRQIDDVVFDTLGLTAGEREAV